MRRLILLLALIGGLWAQPAGAAVAFVQAKGNGGSGGGHTTIAVTFDAAVTSGNTVACIVGYESGVTISTVADNQSNTYTVVRTVTDAGNGERASSFYKYNITNAPTTITVTFSGATNNSGISCQEMSGVLTASTPLDVETGQSQPTPGTGSNAVTSGSVTTSDNGQYIFGGTVDVGAFRAGAEYTAGTGFTERVEFGDTNGSALDSASESQTQTSAGSIAATFTSANGDASITFIMTFKAVGGGGGGATTPRLLLLGVGE